MAKYDLAGVHVMNKWVWSKLEQDMGMSKSSYKGLVPIIPTQQIPVFNDMGPDRPFIVYTYVNEGYDIEFWGSVEQITYRLYSDDEAKLRGIVNYLVDLLKRYNWSAEELNDFVFAGTIGDADDRKFDFKYTQVVSASGPEPFENDNGRQAATVTIRLCYTHLSNSEVGYNLGMRS